jgi:hypothetical protein
MTMCFGWGLLFDRSVKWGVLAYLFSLTPLLRFSSADQAWNRLDIFFPLAVFIGLVAVTGRAPRQRVEAKV